MAGNKMMMILLALVASMAVTASAASHIVGGSAGWTIPSSSSLYSQWASSHKYAVGDTLIFNFTTGIHNVMEVPKASYDSCSKTNQIGSTLTTGPATVTLTKPGMHYFICGVTGHCSIGQKLAVNVVSSASPAPKTPKSASTPTSAPVSAPKASTPVSAPKASAPAITPNVAPASSPAVTPSVAPTSGLGAAPAPSIAPKSPVADSPTSNVAPSGNNGGSLGPTSSDNQNPTATEGPSDGNSASSAPVSTLGGGFLGSIVLAALFSTAFLC